MKVKNNILEKDDFNESEKLLKGSMALKALFPDRISGLTSSGSALGPLICLMSKVGSARFIIQGDSSEGSSR